MTNFRLPSLLLGAALILGPLAAPAQTGDAAEGAGAGHGAGGTQEHAMPGDSGVAPVGDLRRSISFEIGQRNIKSILIDGNEVWLGSSGGVIRYDTRRGSYLTYDNKSGLLSNGVFHLSKHDGEL